MKISVVGVGYLGAVHAAALSSWGFRVTAVDTDPAKVLALNSGVSPIHEPRFPELLKGALADGNLRFTSDFAEIANCDVHFLCVGTPQQADGAAADLGQVWSALKSMGPYLHPGSILVGKSTVPVGTAQAIAHHLEREQKDVTVLWNPEFLREGFAIRDTLHPDRIVVGAQGGPGNTGAVDVLRGIYGEALSAGTPFLITDLATAELVKVAANAFLATKISFINAMAEVCEAAGGDVALLAQAIGHDARIGPRFLRAGIGFGGGCLPKDIRAFRARAEELGAGQALEFLGSVDAINQRCRERAFAAAERLLGVVAGSEVAVLGAAFKPDSDDIRDSPALDIAAQLHAAGARVRVHDPKALGNVAVAYPHLDVSWDLKATVAGADLVLVLTEWREYQDLDPEALGRLVGHRRVFDGRNCLDAARWGGAGWRYEAMGLSDGTRDRTGTFMPRNGNPGWG